MLIDQKKKKVQTSRRQVKMGHTSTLNGSPELLLMVPNTSHKKVMKPNHLSTSNCWSPSRREKSVWREMEKEKKWFILEDALTLQSSIIYTPNHQLTLSEKSGRQRITGPVYRDKQTKNLRRHSENIKLHTERQNLGTFLLWQRRTTMLRYTESVPFYLIQVLSRWEVGGYLSVS